MYRRILTMLAAAVLALSVLVPAASLGESVMYVYTANGKSLNVRSSPAVEDNNIITTFPFGTEVYVDYHLGNGWTALYWTGSQYYHVYVQTRFLVSTKPVKPVNPTPASVGDTASTVAELNAIFKTYRQVTPYLVLVRPTRASGWVNVRFAPTKQSELLGQYRTNDQLLVIAEMTNWYQVEDPETGAVGYVSDKYVLR